MYYLRHPSYAFSGGKQTVTERGHDQMRAMAQRLSQDISNAESALILCSTAPRALQGKDTFNQDLSLPVEEHELLWSDALHAWNFAEATRLIQSRDEVDLVIVITHLEYAEELPSFVAAAYDFPAAERKHFSVKKGDAVVIDIENKSSELIAGLILS